MDGKVYFPHVNKREKATTSEVASKRKAAAAERFFNLIILQHVLWVKFMHHQHFCFRRKAAKVKATILEEQKQRHFEV